MENLRCEYHVNPLGIDNAQPELDWVLESKEHNQKQSAYQVMVSSAEHGGGDLWDSGKVLSNESVGVIYAGKALSSGQRVFWKVRVWDGEDKPTEYSHTAWWEMGLLAPADWEAKWISGKPLGKLTEPEMFADHPAPLLRKEFALEKKIQRARIYVSGLGYYELHLNGQRVGDQVLDPGWTTYGKRVLYSTYDVTTQLQGGTNALGLMIGNGWYNPLPLRMWGAINPRDALAIGEPRAILQLVVEFADGTTQTVTTDESWKTGDGPILRNSVYLGEVYDARKEQAGWDRAGFAETNWTAARIATEPLGQLRAQEAPPIRITRVLKPVKITEPKPGVYIFDMGQNFAGWARLHIKGAAGTRIKMRYGELLYKDGSLNGMTAVVGQIKGGGTNYVYDGTGQPKTAFELDEYVLKGEGDEIYTPHFTFHGFRYVEVTGLSFKPDLTMLEGLRLNSDVQPVGEFSCSNDMFNRIQEMVLWTELSNLFSVESDCPHREKFGYGGDIMAASEMAMFNFDMSRFYTKAAHDLADAARTNGGFTETAPYVGIADESLGGKAGPIGWGSSHPWLIWQLYQYYGEKRLMVEQYDAVRKWVGFLENCSKENILDNGISDHESLVPKPRALTGTAFYYLNACLLKNMADVLGKTNDSDKAFALSEEIKTAFNKKFFDESIGRYDSGSQACQSFPLYMGLVLPDMRERVLNGLVNAVERQGAGHLNTGIFGTKYMLNALSDGGRADVAYGIVNQKSFPGWGHMLENGATTLWEHWEYSDNTYSHNHPMFGSVSEWFYKALAGINPAPDAVGFNKIVIRPQPVGDLKWAKGSYNSVRGKITSEWKIADGTFILDVTIPANTTAVVEVPGEDAQLLGEKVLAGKSANGHATFAIGSGSYRFAASVSK